MTLVKDPTYKQMAGIFDLPMSSIQTVIKNFKERGTVESPPKTGRPRKTTPRQDRQMVIESKRDPWLVAGYVYNVLGLLVLLKFKNMFCKSLVFYIVCYYFLEKFEILLKPLINLKRKKVLN